MQKKNLPDEPLAKAPFLGSWKAIYAFVMLVFVITVGLFYWFTLSYS